MHVPEQPVAVGYFNGADRRAKAQQLDAGVAEINVKDFEGAGGESVM